MASNGINLTLLSDQELDRLRQAVIAEEIRRIEQDPNAIVIEADAPIEEDLKALDAILAKIETASELENA
jgi:hypothetical protein